MTCSNRIIYYDLSNTDIKCCRVLVCSTNVLLVFFTKFNKDKFYIRITKFTEINIDKIISKYNDEQFIKIGSKK